MERGGIRQQQVIDRLTSSYKNNRIGHAYLFDGERGTGKKDVAIFFATLLLCQKPVDATPCGECHSCTRVASGNHPNLSFIYPDGQDIKIDQIRDLISNLSRKGYESGRKVYIIHEADRLNAASSNAILKFLEEPVGEVTAILLTDTYQKILSTIQSRCQRILFLPPSREMTLARLVEKGITQSMAATVTMLTSDIEEALILANDNEFALMRKTVLKLVEAADRNIQEALLFIQIEWNQVFKEKNDTELGLDLLLYAYRDIVAAKSGLSSVPTFPDNQSVVDRLSMRMTYSQLSTTLEVVLQAKRKLHGNMNRTLLMEQLVLNMQEGLRVV